MLLDSYKDSVFFFNLYHFEFSNFDLKLVFGKPKKP